MEHDSVSTGLPVKEEYKNSARALHISVNLSPSSAKPQREMTKFEV